MVWTRSFFGLDHLLSWVRIWLRPLENWLGILHEVGLSEPGRFFSRLDWPIQQINQLQMIYSSQSHFLFKSKSSIAKLLKPKKEERGGPWKPIFKILRQGKRSDHASKGPFSFLFFSFPLIFPENQTVHVWFRYLRIRLFWFLPPSLSLSLSHSS